MCEIRPATEADIPNLLALAEFMHIESRRYSRYPIDPYKLDELIRALITEPIGLILIAELRGAVVGTFWGMLSEMFFGRVRVSQDLLLYIMPEFRGGRAAFRMLKYYEKWSIELGAQEIQVAVSADIDNQRAERFYTGLGFAAVGHTFVKEVVDV